MSYLTQSVISANTAMFNRVAQCAATEGDPDANTWTATNARTWAAAPGWSEAWESALAGDPDSDPGTNEAVITDQMILAQVQAMIATPLPEGATA